MRVSVLTSVLCLIVKNVATLYKKKNLKKEEKEKRKYWCHINKCVQSSGGLLNEAVIFNVDLVEDDLTTQRKVISNQAYRGEKCSDFLSFLFEKRKQQRFSVLKEDRQAFFNTSQSRLFPDASLVRASARESRSATQVAPLEISDSWAVRPRTCCCCCQQ